MEVLFSKKAKVNPRITDKVLATRIFTGCRACLYRSYCYNSPNKRCVCSLLLNQIYEAKVDIEGKIERLNLYRNLKGG